MRYVRVLFLISSLCLLAVMRAHAQGDLDDPEIARTIRAKYIQSANLPDGLAFYITMNTLSMMNSVDRESAIGSVQDNMGLSPSESEQVLDHLLRTLDSLKIDHDKISRDLACTPSRRPPAGDEIYSVFEAMDDAWGTVGRRYLAITKKELGQENSARLQQWVESNKFSIAHVMYRHKEHWEQTGGNPNETLLGICSGVNARLGEHLK